MCPWKNALKDQFIIMLEQNIYIAHFFTHPFHISSLLKPLKVTEMIWKQYWNKGYEWMKNALKVNWVYINKDQNVHRYAVKEEKIKLLENEREKGY